jgi:hypothetical protein
MPEISAAELYELFLDAVGRCTSDVRDRSDDELLYDLFEQFDVGAWSFLHVDSLAKLRNAGYIDDEMAATSHQVRARWLALQNESHTVEDIRTRKEWQELFELCDSLKLKSNLRRLPSD